MFLIPARGGSKRLPRKNLAEVGGRTLVQRAVDCAYDAINLLPVNFAQMTTVVVSTDDIEIVRHVRTTTRAAVLGRPGHLAEDETPMLPVVRHAVENYNIADTVVLLQPTSPFRDGHDVAACLAMLPARNADAVVSVTEPEADLVFEIGHAGRLRPKPEVVVPNGGIYVLTVASLLGGGDFYSGAAYAYRMPRLRSLDVDTPQDLAMARAVVDMEGAA